MDIQKKSKLLFLTFCFFCLLIQPSLSVKQDLQCLQIFCADNTFKTFSFLVSKNPRDIDKKEFFKFEKLSKKEHSYLQCLQEQKNLKQQKMAKVKTFFRKFKIGQSKLEDISRELILLLDFFKNGEKHETKEGDLPVESNKLKAEFLRKGKLVQKECEKRRNSSDKDKTRKNKIEVNE